MNESVIFIIMKDMVDAGMLKYMLAGDHTTVHLFPNVPESTYCIEKGKVPDFIIYDQNDQNLDFSSFLSLINPVLPEANIILLVDHDDDPYVQELLSEGASDIILKTSCRQGWMTELAKNILYLRKSISI